MMKLSFLDKLHLKISNKKRMLIMGDSHTAVFSETVFQDAISNKYNCYIETVGGATISGLNNPNSKTNAQALFANAYDLIKPDVLITQIGEVDTGFVIWYRAQKHQTPVSKMLDTCVQNYEAFLRRYQGKEKTVVVSAPLPTIRDDQEWGEIANLRKEVTASQSDRTALTIEFNSRIANVAKKLGVFHINLDAESAGENGIVADFLLNTDPNDHHYARQAYLPLLMNHLKALL